MLSFLVIPLVLCAVVLLISGVAKVREPQATRDAFVALRLPRALSASPAPALLPWAELLLGAWLLLASGWLLVVGALATLALFGIYLAIVTRALGFGERVSCSCFGKLGEDGISRRTVVRNGVLVTTATLALIGAALGVSVPGALTADVATLGWLVMAALAGAVALLVLGRGRSDAAPAQSLTEGSYVPYGTMVDAATGNEVVLRDLKDDRTLLLLLSLWCGGCQVLMDGIDDLRAALPGVRVRPVVSDRAADELRARPASVQTGALLDPHGNLMATLTTGTPTALLLDRFGRLLADPAVGTDAVQALVAAQSGTTGQEPEATPAQDQTHDHDQAPDPVDEVAPAEVEEDPYERLPIPNALVLDAAGKPRTLHEVTSSTAALLISTTCLCGGSREAGPAVDRWRTALPQLEVHLLTSMAPEQLSDDVLPTGGALYDHAGLAQAALGLQGSPTAMLLGADGLIAGGPVQGLDEIEAFVADIAAQLAEAGVAAEPEAGA